MRRLLFITFCLLWFESPAQSDADYIKTIYKNALTDGYSYEWLDYLSNEIGGRLSGSLNAEYAVEYTKSELQKLGLDRVWLQPVMVPKWVRGNPEFGYIETAPGKTISVNICALGGSVATTIQGVKAEVIEVNGIEELKSLDPKLVKGKIVFFNRPMQADLILTFEAYGGCVDQRYNGAEEAGKLGAVATLVRSMNLRLDDLPHTGAMSYGKTPVSKRIPSSAISTNDAEKLSSMLKIDPSIKLFLKQNCRQLKDVLSYNVIGEIKGSEFPNEIITVGGHLDSWDLGDGSHDDGAGCVQSMDVLRLLQNSGIKPKRTIRVVLFMNEENGNRGGLSYAENASEKNEKHLMALESDRGGFSPRGFSVNGSQKQFNAIKKWAPLFEPYGIYEFKMGFAGVDINPLKDDKICLIGLSPDSQRYFDHHHSDNDVFEEVNKRELELGAASMASIVYLIDKYWLY